MSASNPNPVPGIPARIAWAGIVDKIEPNYQGNFEHAYAGSKYTSRLDNLYIRDATNQLVHKGGDCTIHNTTADDKRRQTDDKRGPTLFFRWDYFRADSMGNGNRPFPSDKSLWLNANALLSKCVRSTGNRSVEASARKHASTKPSNVVWTANRDCSVRNRID